MTLPLVRTVPSAILYLLYLSYSITFSPLLVSSILFSPSSPHNPADVPTQDPEDRRHDGSISPGRRKSQPRKKKKKFLSTSSSSTYSLPVIAVVKKRIGWLMLLFLAETFTGSVLRTFEHELAQVVASPSSSHC